MATTIDKYLNERANDLMVYRMPKNETLMDEIFKFDPRNLEVIDSVNLSKYAIGLSQFLIYFTSQINKSKVLLIQKKRVIDVYVNKSDIKARTRAEKMRKVIDEHESLQKIESDIEALESELTMTENLEKYYIELINSIKRELTRRENEKKFAHDSGRRA